MNCLKIYPIKTIIILFSLLVIILGRGDYLFYHFVLKMISIIIFFTIFFVGWNSREFTGEHSFLFIAIACMIIGLFDIFHMITYNGTVFFDYIVPDIHSKLWVAARLTESFSLLIALLILKYHKFINIDLVFSIYFLLTMIILFDILYYQKIFPVCFVEGRGFTRFRICSECLIILTFLFSIYLIVKEKGLLHPQLRQLALISLSLSVIAEVFISLNAYNPYNFTHMLGQIFKVLALVYLFRALVEEVLKKPYRNLFQQHNYSQHKLIVSASFLSTMVHDLKNPLANIRALCQLSKIAKTEEKREANLNKIINNVDQLTDMLNKIMDTIREDKFIECDLENVISEVIEEIRPVCVTRDIQLTYQLDKDIPVLLERSMFKRAIYNILKNAIDAIEESGKLSIYLEKKWNKALVIIKDNGPGIPEEIQGSLFQPFVSSKGTGLGLYMVDFTITQIHKGKVWFDTFKGKGTTFYIELPLLKNNPIFNMGTYLLGRS